MIFFSPVLQAQNLDVSRPVFWWSVCHPFAAFKAKKITTETLHVCDSIYQDSVSLGQNYGGGQLDAFRHVFWMCRLTQEIGPRKAYRLGLKYEKGNRRQFEKKQKEDSQLPDSMSTVMDLVNNQFGVELGMKMRIPGHKISQFDQIRTLVNRTKAGDFRILFQDRKGNFYSCAGERIDLKKYHGQWAVPKCLVKSNVFYD